MPASSDSDREENVSAVVPEDNDVNSGSLQSTWCGYTATLDNIDTGISPSFQRLDKKKQSLHHTQSFAVKDRLDMTHMSEEPPKPCEHMPSDLLPSAEDITALKEELGILLSRCITEFMDDFRGEGKQIVQHIPCQYGKEMASKSVIVPLGVQPLNENKLDDMSQILDNLHDLVPTIKREGHIKLANGSLLEFDDTNFFKILVGGDQLSVARARGAQAMRASHDSPLERLEGIIPVIEDWHSRMTLMRVLWQILYSPKSSKEKGTLYQLRNVINRSSVPRDPKDDMKAAEDFMHLVLYAHIIAAAETVQSLLGESAVADVARAILSTYVLLPFSEEKKKQESAFVDKVHLYACETLTLGLLWWGFYDAIREGDGNRILRYWKFLLLVFKSTNHPNYAKEAVNLLMQYYYFFSERQKAQLLWSRTVNTRGVPGANMPCDLKLEHLNRQLKTMMSGMGGNISSKAIVKAAKTIGPVHQVCEAFEADAKKSSNRHSFPSMQKDLDKVLDVLREGQVFMPVSDRFHPTFPKMRCGILKKYSKKELIKKVQDTITLVTRVN